MHVLLRGSTPLARTCMTDKGFKRAGVLSMALACLLLWCGRRAAADCSCDTCVGMLPRERSPYSAYSTGMACMIMKDADTQYGHEIWRVELMCRDGCKS
jgi:hypothetical protein